MKALLFVLMSLILQASYPLHSSGLDKSKGDDPSVSFPNDSSIFNEDKKLESTSVDDTGRQSDPQSQSARSQIVMNPNTGPKCTLYEFEITGQNTSFLAAGIYSIYLTDQNPNYEEYQLYNFQVVSDTLITIHDVLPCMMNNNYHQLKIETNNQGNIVVPNAFLVTQNPNSHTASISPSNGSIGQTVYVNVNGTNTWFQFARLTTSGIYSPNIGFSFGYSDYTIVNNQHAIVRFDIPSNAITGNYFMSFLNDKDGMFTWGFYISGPVGIEDQEEHQANVRIFPNPSNGLFTIEGSANSAKVSVFNALGVEVYRGEQVLTAMVDLSDQPKGIYFLKIESDENIILKKIVIN